MNRPEFISIPDWNILITKYPVEYIKKKLEENYPVQYLIGDVDFYGNKILVDKNVLIPRYETELLVENTIKLIKKENLNKINILDIGTGSGCIAISLAKSLDAKINAIDISKKALKVANKNAKINNVKIRFIKKDILKNKIKGKYDLIISNPPYIDEEDQVDPKTKYEPQNALFADKNGLIFYEEILKKSVGHLNKNGIIAFEIGMNQANDIKKIVDKFYPNCVFILKKDYQDRDRMIFIINKD